MVGHTQAHFEENKSKTTAENLAHEDILKQIPFAVGAVGRHSSRAAETSRSKDLEGLEA